MKKKLIVIAFILVGFLAIIFFISVRWGLDIKNSWGLPALKDPSTSQDAVNPQTLAAGEAMEVLLYYEIKNTGELGVEKRSIVNVRDCDREIIILDELLKGPKTEGFNRLIPQEVKIISAETKDKVCFVNFSQDFAQITTKQQLVILSIVNTLTELPQIEKVQILVNGKNENFFKDIKTNLPISRT